MESPVGKYLNRTDLRQRGVPQGEHIEQWLRQHYEGIQIQLRSGMAFYNETEQPYGRIDAVLTLSVGVRPFSPKGPYGEALRSRMLSDGWQMATYEIASQDDVKLTVSAFPLFPVIVIDDREEFPLEMQTEESPHDAAVRATREGTWRHFEDGTREFIPPRRIHAVRLITVTS